MKKIYILSLALIYAHISRLLAGVKNAPGQGALVSKYVVFDDFGGPVGTKPGDCGRCYQVENRSKFPGHIVTPRATDPPENRSPLITNCTSSSIWP